MTAGLVFGQSQRVVLVQHFTQASCGPCAGQNPTLESTLNANAGDVVAIKHQVSWPGSDPMYNAYPAGPDAKVSQYGITGVPNTVMDGGAPGAPNTVVTNSTIASRAAVASPFDISLSGTIDPATQLLNVTMDITCTQAVSGNLVAHIAVIEKHITYAEAGTPGGTNGETDYYDVLRQYLPAPGGTTIASSFSVSQTETVNESWDFTNGKVADMNDLAIVAFIQDMTTDEVHQAAEVDVTITPVGANDGGLVDITNIPIGICDGSFAPEIVIMNWGSATLSSATIDYEINGGTPMTYNYSGSLSLGQSETVTLPAYSFTVGASNPLNVDITSVNGGSDVNTANDNANDVLVEPANTAMELDIEIMTASYADEIYWEVTDGSATVVATGGNENVAGNYGTGTFPPPADPTSPLQNTTFYTWNVPLSAVDCYTFTIYDYYGDGMLGYGGDPDGTWTVKSNTGVTLATGSGNYGDLEEGLTKNTAAATNVEVIVIDGSLNVYPNPFTDIATVEFNMAQAANVTFNVYNMLGELVHTEGLGTIEGENLINFNGSDLEAGMYMFHMVLGEQVISKRVSLTK